MFADTAVIDVRAGKGGDGRLGFRHEKYRAKGGPDGGDGGRGGNVILKVDHNLNTLSAYRSSPKINAEDGQSGGANRMKGRSGEDVIVAVPQGTQVYENAQLIADLDAVDAEVVIASGGRGGFGNAHFTASTRQAPRTAELGEAGEAKKLKLELKMVAEVGLVGLPNAGKSTLLSVITNAKPEIGDYPFTTLIPNLGVVDHHGHSLLVADIPGLIEGAHAGKGLGDEFLRHVERTSVLLHLVDGLAADVVADWGTIAAELISYGRGLADKPRLTILTKSDGLTPSDLEAKLQALTTATGGQVYTMSAQAHRGLDEILDAVWPLVETDRAAREAHIAEAAATITLSDLPGAAERWSVVSEGERAWRLHGEKLEGFARRTNFESEDAVRRLQDILHKTGVSRQLKKLGAQDGDRVFVGDHAVEWSDRLPGTR